MSFWIPVFFFVLDSLMFTFSENTLKPIDISNTYWDSALFVFCLHFHKSNRTKPCILLSKLIEVSRLIQLTTLLFIQTTAFFSSFLSCKAAPSMMSFRSFFQLGTNNLLMRFSNSTSAAHIPESSCLMTFIFNKKIVTPTFLCILSNNTNFYIFYPLSLSI